MLPANIFAGHQASYPSLQDKIHRHLPKLVRLIEPDFGLLDELRSKRILDDIHIAHVRAGVNLYEQNNRLLEYLKWRNSDDVCQQFLTALKTTQQEHVANYIEYDGGQYKYCRFHYHSVNQQIVRMECTVNLPAPNALANDIYLLKCHTTLNQSVRDFIAASAA